MRNYKILILIALGIGLWVLALIFGPTVTKKEPTFWEPGLLLLVIGVGMYCVYLLSFMYVYRIVWHGGNSTLYQPTPIDEVELPMEDGLRSRKFFLFALGGSPKVLAKGGGDHGYMWVSADLVYQLKGDIVNVIINSIPDLYVFNPLGRQKSVAYLPPKFKERLYAHKSFREDKSPVYVAWEPVELTLPPKTVSTMLNWKSIAEESFKTNQDLTDRLNDANAISGKIAEIKISDGNRTLSENSPKGRARARNRNQGGDEEDDETR